MMTKSHGDGRFERSQFAHLGENVIFEPGVLVFHPENIHIGNHVYIGHNTILKGYFKNSMKIGEGTWIGQQCFFHSAGTLTIGKNVGIGPGVKILTSSHSLKNADRPILHNPIIFSSVTIGNGSDIGTGAIVLPGVSIGNNVQVGAGAVVTSNIADQCISAGNPARVIRNRL